jgi:hypothetical protein
MSKGQATNRQKNISRVVRDQRRQCAAKIKVIAPNNKPAKSHG